MQFALTIDTGGDSFGIEHIGQIAGMLRHAAQQIERNHHLHGRLMDRNGNYCGSFDEVTNPAEAFADWIDRIASAADSYEAFRADALGHIASLVVFTTDSKLAPVILTDEDSPLPAMIEYVRHPDTDDAHHVAETLRRMASE